MHIKSINLKNYRNYDELHIELNKGINIFYGQNAQGKTNIIESINLLATGKSHRTQKDTELIKWEKEECKVALEYEREEIENSLDIYLKKNNKKQIKVNGVKLNKTSELLGNLLTVIFSPDHMKIIKEGPSERRKFIDIILSQIKPGYYYNLLQYLRVMEQRNNLISESFNNKKLLDTLNIWDTQLIDYGCKLIKERIEFLNEIYQLAKKTHKNITNNKEDLNIIYKSSVPTSSDDINLLKIEYEKKLKLNRTSDLRRGTTQIGPHRDDIKFYINEKEVKVFGSQGQQRTTLLSLKISELEYIKNQCFSYPVLLLDDVFSELDTERQSYLMEFIKDKQAIITCTDVEYFKNIKLEDYFLFNVYEGRLTKKIG